MAGQIALDTKYYPSDFNVVQVMPPLSTSGGGGMQFIPLLYADRTLVVDSILVYIPTAVSTASTLTVYYITNTAIPVTTSIPTTQVQMTNTTATFPTGAGNYPSRTSLALRTTGTTANNLVPEGSTVWAVFSNPVTAGMTQPLAFHVRCRSQI